MKKWSKTVLVKGRRHGALKRLEAQLKLGTKPTKEGKTVKLSEKDIKRIKKEINILKSRL